MKKKFYLPLMAAAVTLSASAQNPGAVSANLKLWLKSNSGTSTIVDGTPLVSWIYANDNTKIFGQASPTEQPTYNTNGINFQPVVTFSGDFMDGPTGVNAPIPALDDDYSVFAVWNSNSLSNANNPQRVWSQRSTTAINNGVSLWLFNSQFGDQPEIAPFTTGLGVNYAIGEFKIGQLNLLATATADLEVIDQNNLATPLVKTTDPANNSAALRVLSDEMNRLGARVNAGDEPFDGRLAELIVFDRPINGAERNRIYSYLAMKYGVTLPVSLVNSAGTVVWNASTNATFNFSVFGLSRDDASGLTVSQSNSIVTGSGNGTGKSTAGNIVISTPSSLDNNDYLQIGNNNAALTEQTTDLPAIAAGSSRFSREWKVQHTGDVGTVSLSFDFTGLTTTGTVGTATSFRIIVDADGDGDFTTGTIRYYGPSGFTGNVANFPLVTLNNNEVFAIVTNAVPITLAVTWKSFTASVKDNGSVYLQWNVEDNNKTISYVVEHSTDGQSFSSLGEVSNRETLKAYNFTQRGVESGVHYYRIREVDIDGKSLYSKVVKIQVKAPAHVVYLFANPVRDYARVIIQSERSTGKAVVELLSVNGSRISTETKSVVRGQNQLDIDLSKAQPGSYILRVSIDETVQNLKVVKQ